LSFVRSKMIRGYGPYYYKVENHWTDDGSRQKVILYLGRNPGDHASDGRKSGRRPDTQDAQPGKGNEARPKEDKREARDGIDRAAKDAQEALARNEAERKIIDSSDAPEAKKEEVEKRRTRKAADQLRAAKDKGQRSLKDYHEDELDNSKRSQKKWSAQRKKEAKSTADRIGSSAIQADALNQRAKRAGRDYDQVDWDAVQGKDLTYSERVGKLDSQLGTNTRTKGDISRSSRGFEATVSKWESDPDAYQEEMEAASREMFYDMKAEAN